MVKVCFLISSLCNEGPVNVMYNIIRYMDFSRFEVSIITFIPEKKTTRIQDFRKLPIIIHQLYPNDTTNPLRLFTSLKKKVKEINPDILHAHCPRSLYLMCFLPKKYKRVYTIHIYPGLQQTILYGKLKGNLVISLNHFFTKKTDLPIGCAESVGDLYKKRKKWDILSIPNGSSLPIWEGDEKAKKQLRHRLGMRDDLQYFIFIGRFSAEKNPQILINAFKKLKNKQVGLIMLGNGPMWQDLKQAENDYIMLPGFKSNVYDYLVASDYYLSASDVEGLANTLLESMTVGLPMLLSDIPSHREILSKMKETIGYIFDNKNTNDLYNKILQILESINKDKAAVEIKRVFRERYTAQTMSASYQTAYIKLHSNKK